MQKEQEWNLSHMASVMREQLTEIPTDELNRMTSELVSSREIICHIRETENKVKLWLVYDEVPTSKTDGYLIVFDPQKRQFGLAVKSKRPGREYTFLDLYGTFKEALHSM